MDKTKNLFTLEEECDDSFYGYFIVRVFSTKERASKFLEKLVSERGEWYKERFRLGEIVLDDETMN